MKLIGEKLDKRKRRRKKKVCMEEIASKMQLTVGVGPIEQASIDYFEREVKDVEVAKKLAVTEYLRHFLDFDENELADMKIVDTKCAVNDKVIYFAVEDQEYVKEIHRRRAASQNEDLMVRDYIPPQFWERYTTLAKVAAENRSNDTQLKTQIRWGPKDV